MLDKPNAHRLLEICVSTIPDDWLLACDKWFITGFRMRTSEFKTMVEEKHKWLASDGLGKGFGKRLSSAIFCALCILYLRWTRGISYSRTFFNPIMFRKFLRPFSFILQGNIRRFMNELRSSVYSTFKEHVQSLLQGNTMNPILPIVYQKWVLYDEVKEKKWIMIFWQVDVYSLIFIVN